MDNSVSIQSPLIPSSIRFFDRIRSHEYEHRHFHLDIGKIIKNAYNRWEKSLTYKVQFHKALAKFKNSFKATILRICRALQR